MFGISGRGAAFESRGYDKGRREHVVGPVKVKAYQRLRPLVAVLSPLLLLGLAGEPTDDERLRRAVAFYIPKDFARADVEDRVSLLKDLQPLIEKLEETRPFADSKESDSKDNSSKPRKGFQESVKINLSEGPATLLGDVWLRMWSYESFKRAEEGYAHNVSMINIAMKTGSLTGQQVGELCRHHVDSRSASIIFMRRNVVASLACRGPDDIRNAKNEPSSHVDDLQLKSKCENFAKKIDKAIIRLTNK
jgi:hypothetical protein